MRWSAWRCFLLSLASKHRIRSCAVSGECLCSDEQQCDEGTSIKNVMKRFDESVEMQNQCAEINICAERWAEQITKAMKNNGELADKPIPLKLKRIPLEFTERLPKFSGCSAAAQPALIR